MDDVIILHPDKRHLARVKEEIEEFLFNELHLQLNKKTTIRPTSMGIDFVGFRIWATHRKLKKKTAIKIKSRLKYLFRAYSRGEITKEKLDRSIASYRGILKHCNSYKFRQGLNKLYMQKPANKTLTVVDTNKGDTIMRNAPDKTRTCYNCKHYYTSCFCGYIQSLCKIYGSLDCDQHERHPDTEAVKCKQFSNLTRKLQSK